MFIIQNGKITSAKTLDIGKARIVNLTFKSDLAFADGDRFKLVLGTIESENFAFVNNGCFRFSYVDVTALVKSTSNNVAVKVYQNGNQILSDSITMIADYQGGGGGSTVTAEFPLTTERVQLFSKKVGTNQYQLNKVAPDSNGYDGYTVGSKQTAQHQFNYNLDFNYQISPVDDLKVVIGLRTDSRLYVTAQLYIDDVLIKKGISYRNIAGFITPSGSYYRVIDLNENFANELITNTVGKNLKLKIYVQNDTNYNNGYTISYGNSTVQPTLSANSDTGQVKLLKNIPLFGMDELYGFTAYEKYLTGEMLPSMFSEKSKVEKYDSKENFTVGKNQYYDIIIPSLYFETYGSFQPNTYFDLNIIYTDGYFENPKMIVIRTADTLDYNVSITTYDDQNKDILINKPFDFQPNKAYMIFLYQNIIVWQELQKY